MAAGSAVPDWAPLLPPSVTLILCNAAQSIRHACGQQIPAPAPGIFGSASSGPSSGARSTGLRLTGLNSSRGSSPHEGPLPATAGGPQGRQRRSRRTSWDLGSSGVGAHYFHSPVRWRDFSQDGGEPGSRSPLSRQGLEDLKGGLKDGLHDAFSFTVGLIEGMHRREGEGEGEGMGTGRHSPLFLWRKGASTDDERYDGGRGVAERESRGPQWRVGSREGSQSPREGEGEGGRKGNGEGEGEGEGTKERGRTGGGESTGVGEGKGNSRIRALSSPQNPSNGQRSPGPFRSDSTPSSPLSGLYTTLNPLRHGFGSAASMPSSRRRASITLPMLPHQSKSVTTRGDEDEGEKGEERKGSAVRRFLSPHGTGGLRVSMSSVGTSARGGGGGSPWGGSSDGSRGSLSPFRTDKSTARSASSMSKPTTPTTPRSPLSAAAQNSSGHNHSSRRSNSYGGCEDDASNPQLTWADLPTVIRPEFAPSASQSSDRSARQGLLNALSLQQRRRSGAGEGEGRLIGVHSG